MADADLSGFRKSILVDMKLWFRYSRWALVLALDRCRDSINLRKKRSQFFASLHHVLVRDDGDVTKLAGIKRQATKAPVTYTKPFAKVGRLHFG